MSAVVTMHPRHASCSILDDRPSQVLQDQWCSMHGQARSSSKLFDSLLQIGQQERNSNMAEGASKLLVARLLEQKGQRQQGMAV